MAMGRQGPRQGEMLVTWDELPKSPGHAFYDRLQAVLIEAGFDAWSRNYAGPATRPPWVRRRCRPAATSGCIWSATSRASTARPWL